MLTQCGHATFRLSTFFVLVSVSAMVFSTPSLLAQQSPGSKAKPDKLFTSEETIEVTLTGPWRMIQRNKENQQPYPGKLAYQDAQGNAVVLDVTYQRRGITRQRVCDFPPIRIEFEKAEVKGTMFRGQSNLKMVTHCQKGTRIEQYYILEMLAYRMYNQITDFSFRVRPLKVTYVDSDSGRSDEERFAFLIEDDSDVAKRHGLKKLNLDSIKLSQLQPGVTNELSLFQYMIGNVDWAALAGPEPGACCHNVKLIGPEPLRSGEKAYPLPYDFDSSGLVNAHYAAPPAGLPIRHVTQRLYRGYCVDNSSLEGTRQQFIAKESDMYDLLENEPLLFTNTRKKAVKYIGKFYKTIKSSKNFNKDIIQKCRK